MKYYEEAEEILKYIGSESNIISLTHCITRLRFKLKDETKVDFEKIKELEIVVTVLKSGGQVQIVIGDKVSDVYETINVITSNKELVDSNASNQVYKKESFVEKMIDIVSGIFQPILGVLTAAGMIKGFLALFLAFGWLGIDSGSYIIFNAIGDALFIYLPVILGYTAAKKFGMKPFIGLIIGMILCYPDIQQSAISESIEPLYTIFTGTIFSTDVYLEIFGIPFIAMDYFSTVVPVILICYIASKFDILFTKFIPNIIGFFMVPMLTILCSLVIGFLFIGPLATYSSIAITSIIMSIRTFSPLLAGAIVGFTWQILVIFGLHWGFLPIYINNIQTLGFDNVMMPFFATTFATTAVVIAILLKTKNKKLKSLCIPAAISGIFGISEPAIYGILLPLKKPFIISCIASGIAGAYLGYADLKEFIIGGLGIFEFPAMIDPQTNSFDNVVVGVTGVIIAMVIAFVLTMIFYRDEKNK